MNCGFHFPPLNFVANITTTLRNITIVAIWWEKHSFLYPGLLNNFFFTLRNHHLFVTFRAQILWKLRIRLLWSVNAEVVLDAISIFFTLENCIRPLLFLSNCPSTAYPAQILHLFFMKKQCMLRRVHTANVNGSTTICVPNKTDSKYLQPKVYRVLSHLHWPIPN